MTQFRYVNDLGNGHSGYVDYGSGIVVVTTSGQPIQVANISGQPIQVTNISGQSIQVANISGQPIQVANISGQPIQVTNISGQPLEITTTSGSIVYTQPATTAGDAFGRFKVSNPFTIFDSQHRYQLNDKWVTATGVNGTSAYQVNESAVNLNVTTTSGDYIYRETNRVFPYQPGKSLLTMCSFVFASGKTNLRQRTGLFSTQNGVFFEQSGTTNNLVLRSFSSGTVAETRVPQSSWNYDVFNGSGVSERLLDPTKANIFWCDIEWLGVGDVRAGFVVDGRPEIAHIFHNDNVNATAYMTTAILPLRQEIENVGVTASSSTSKQICATVISEGGYEMKGTGGAIGQAINAKYDLTVVATSYPVVSIRLKSTRADAAIILAGLSLVGATSAHYNWRLVEGGTTTGGTWVSAGSSSAVEYNITGTSFALGTGRELLQGYTASSNQSSSVIDLGKQDLLKYQLKRNSFTSSFTELTLTVAADVAGADVIAAFNWEEI